MKVRGTPSKSAAVSSLVAAALIITALVAVIGSAQAAPQKKVFNATVDVQTLTGLTSTSARLRLTLSNDASSNQTLGSANFVPPTGVTVDAGALTASRTGWNATTVGNVVQFRSTSNPLTVSTNVSTDVNVTINATTCSNATWTAFAKQSNDFSGSGNDFAAGTATNRRPLGSFVIDDVETVVAAEPDDLHVPQILTNTDEVVHVTPYDICGDVYSNYGTSVGRTSTFVAGPASPPRLVGAGSLSINWTSGTTTLNPKVVETGDLLSISDALSTPGVSISATSNEFDVVEKLCTVLDDTCHWNNGNNKIQVDAAPPTDPDASLGIGFVDDDSFDCDGGTSALGGQLIYINPRDYPSGSAGQFVDITYDKTVPGTSGNAANFGSCISKDNGASWDPVPTCTSSTPPLTEAPCILSPRRVQGNLVLTLFFDPFADPVHGGK